MLCVRSAADFFVDVAYSVNFYHFAVSAAEYADGVLLACLFDGHFFAYDRYISLYRVVYRVFDRLFLFIGKRSVKVEVKTQSFSGDVAAFLLYVFSSQNFFERTEEQMRCRMQIGGTL